EHPGGARIDVLTLDLREKESNYEAAIVETIRSAEREVLIATPYFLLPRPVRDALLDVADRGVDVRALTAGKIDVPWGRAAARSQYERLLLGGLRLYEMWDQTLHAKFCSADRARSVVGSYNVDLWGRHFNQEAGIAVWDEGLADGLAGSFFRGVEMGREVTLDEVRGWSAPLRLVHRLNYAAARAVT
ncbi:MAG: phospholipase D-like domain-containing protein, partial [Rhodothermales bacterium]|nr:phospholipase D-like domain-containing protein [Rhodothermales bacterium]